MKDLSAAIRLSQGGFTLDVDITAPGDGITVLFGPSGAGKSTLLSVVAGLKRPDRGNIMLGTRVLDDGRTHVPPRQRLHGTGGRRRGRLVAVIVAPAKNLAQDQPQPEQRHHAVG